MNKALEVHAELRDLLDRLAAGDLNQSELKRLQELAAANAESRDFFVQYMQVDAALQWHYRNDRAAASPATIRPPAFHWLGPIRTNRPLAWAMLAASVMFAAYFTAISWNMWGRPEQHRPEMATHETNAPTKPAVAKISDAGGAVWANESAAKWNEPSISADEPLKIESGIVRLTLTQGTMLTVEAPAEWSVTGDNQALLKRGKMFAHVPPQATGFTLVTPSAQIVDLGTEFNTTVTKAGETKVQVTKGQVQFAQNTAPNKPQRVVAGEAVQASKTADGTVVVERIPFDPKQATVPTPAKPFDRWLEASQKLRTDPGLVAYYDFQAKGAKLKNVVASKLHGEIATQRETPPWTEGRWLGKNALAFGQDFASSVSIADDPALNPKGDFAFAVWFRVDRNPANTTALILGKGNFPTRSYTLFQFPATGFLTSVGKATSGHYSIGAGNPVQIGRWYFAVCTYDSGVMRLYLNGADVGGARQIDGGIAIDDQPLMLGLSREPDSVPFTGVIDEVAIFNRALSAADVAEMYRVGKP